LHAKQRRRSRIPGHNQSSAVHGEGRVRCAVYHRFEFSEQHSNNLTRNEDGSLPSRAHRKVNHPNQKNDEFASLSVDPRKRDIVARHTDSPSFAKLEEKGGVYETGRFLRAGEAARHHYEENGERKFLAYDSLSNEAQTPGGFVGHRRNNEPRK
jgi:nitrate reductase alpha subunit